MKQKAVQAFGSRKLLSGLTILQSITYSEVEVDTFIIYVLAFGGLETPLCIMNEGSVRVGDRVEPADRHLFISCPFL